MVGLYYEHFCDLSVNNLFIANKAWLLAVSLLISGCAGQHYKPAPASFESAALVCIDVQKWQGQVIGDGQCVSLIKRCSGAPQTSLWRPGMRVRGQNLKAGTVIATFEGQHYPSRTGYHAAIYIRQEKSGVWVWDQWQGKPVHRRLIRWQNKHSSKANQGNAYRVVEVDIPH